MKSLPFTSFGRDTPATYFLSSCSLPLCLLHLHYIDWNCMNQTLCINDISYLLEACETHAQGSLGSIWIYNCLCNRYNVLLVHASDSIFTCLCPTYYGAKCVSLSGFALEWQSQASTHLHISCRLLLVRLYCQVAASFLFHWVLLLLERTRKDECVYPVKLCYSSVETITSWLTFDTFVMGGTYSTLCVLDDLRLLFHMLPYPAVVAWHPAFRNKLLVS